MDTPVIHPEKVKSQIWSNPYAHEHTNKVKKATNTKAKPRSYQQEMCDILLLQQDEYINPPMLSMISRRTWKKRSEQNPITTIAKKENNVLNILQAYGSSYAAGQARKGQFPDLCVYSLLGSTKDEVNIERYSRTISPKIWQHSTFLVETSSSKEFLKKKKSIKKDIKIFGRMREHEVNQIPFISINAATTKQRIRSIIFRRCHKKGKAVLKTNFD